MDPRNLAGPLKVALLINSLDEKASKEILNTLSPPEQEKIKKLIPQINAIPAEMVNKVAQEFVERARNTVSDASPQPGRNGSPVNAPYGTSENTPPPVLGAAQSMDPADLVHIIQDEHPQTLALMLAHLDPTVACEILAQLPSAHRADIAIRIGKLGKVNPWMLDEIETYLANSQAERIPAAPQTAGGTGQLAEIIKRLDAEVADTIMEHIESNDDDLADGINQMLFVFDDVVLVDDKGTQQLLRSVETQDLALAMKAVSDEAKDKIFKNMSSRASAMLTEEIESMGPVRMTDVTDAQQKITRLIQDMEKKGELIVKGHGGEEFIG